ncbi:MAG: hypothetical protein WDZ40_01440 [Candidatus Spechtbacterales bacterium]
MNKNILKYVLVVGGLVVSSTLGAVIYGLFISPHNPSDTGNQLSQEITDRQPADFSEDFEKNIGKKNYFGYEQPASVSPEEKAVAFNTPEARASQGEKNVYMEYLRRLSVSTTQIVVIQKNCELNPFVLHSVDRNVGFINKGDASVSLYFYEPKNMELVLEPEEGSEIPFFEGEGVYGYSCGGQNNPAGIVFISG